MSSRTLILYALVIIRLILGWWVQSRVRRVAVFVSWFIVLAAATGLRLSP